ncbi:MULTISPECIES: type II toxin-antitoxin system Phd/YefM family antitoxin [unclassified Microcoleus]|uniref:type II toxin-antitoxin system Phd/YefM family antitoxin n=1 Tax=unclassified Microcoleus TaxID=2642155 RepID=UPI002FD55B9A
MQVQPVNQYTSKPVTQRKEAVVEDTDYTIITRRDAEDAVVMSLEFFNSLLETVHLLKSPANAAHLERSIAQFKQGKVVERNLLDD